MAINPNPKPTIIQKALAWGVHLFTASGLLAGFMALLAINEGDWPEAMLWLLVCQLIDGLDGGLARLARVKEVLPNISGKTIDYVIDFATYAIIPAYFFYQAKLVYDVWQLPCVAIILLASVLYYGKEGMVSDDKYFVGFPVMWNMVVFYQVFIFPNTLLAINLSGWIPAFQVAVVVVFAVLHFVPVKFVYPSQNTRFFGLTVAVTAVFFIMILGAIYYYPFLPGWVHGLAYACVAYYAGMAVWVTWGIEDV